MEGLQAVVRAFVAAERAGVRETAATTVDVTHERLLARVSPLMPNRRRLVPERRPAVATDEVLLPAVRAFVQLQAALQCETGWTKVALERLGFGVVMRQGVCAEMAGLFERRAALRMGANVRFFPCVNAGVDGEVAAVKNLATSVTSSQADWLRHLRQW